ncbi:MAG: non-heme iron oxygenase ferredoxin subunit [Candidatus Nanopelagicaceae bacterium]|jgi:3-phenylpropionate/trans-cinnamate dioxygenase ferredoxin subunit
MIELNINDLAENAPVKVELDGKDLCVVRQGFEVFAVDDMCSHAEASLSEGEVSAGKIECWLHGAEFDLRTGEALTPPAIAPLNTYQVRIEGEKVTITE